MYASFEIKNFRCFSDLTFEPLEKVNLIAGKNNIGKTALLEAIWMHHGYHNPELGIRVDIFRGLVAFKEDEIMSSLFREFDQSKQIILTSKDTQDQEAKLKISRKESTTITAPIDFEAYKQRHGKEISSNSELITSESTETSKPEIIFEFIRHPRTSIKSRAYFDKKDLKFDQATRSDKTIAIYLASNQIDNPQVQAERFGNLAVKKTENEIIKILKIIEPNLSKLIVRFVGGIPIIYGDIGMNRMIPLPLLGDGIGRLLRIALAIADATKGIVLIDEIENGVHYTVLKNVWKAIAQLARKYSTQIFATTHSRECIQAAYEAFTEGKKYDFLLHRLERIRGKISNVVYDKEALEAALKAKFEIR